MRERILDLVFLIGVLFKGIDGAIELIGGAVLVFLSPAQLRGAAHALTARELAAHPHDVLAQLLVHSVAGLDSGGTGFLAAYLLLHGVVKIAIVIALLLGSKRIYPWAIAALCAFLVFQAYELVTAATVGIAVLTAFDAAIVWLTWREWRHGRTLHETMHTTIEWVRRRPITR